MNQKTTSSRANSVRLQVGALFEVERRIVRVMSIQGDLVSTVDHHTKERLAFPSSQLLNTGLSSINLQEVSQRDWDAAMKMHRFLVELLTTGETTNNRIIELSEKHEIGIRTRAIRDVLARFRRSGTVSSCLKMSPGPKRGARLLSSKTEAAIRKAVTTAERKQEMVTFNFLMKEVKHECIQLGASLPSQNSVKRRATELGLDLKRRQMFGPEVAKNNGKVHGGIHTVENPLGEIQIDHTLCDIEVWDETATIFLGRPWLTLCIDVYSRAILGFYLTMKAPSMYAVSRTLLMSALPKDWLLQRMGIDLPWSMYGKPNSILTDNGAEFTSLSFERGCQDVGIIPRLRPLGKKHWGGHIERLIGTFMGKISLLPGTTFRNVKVKARYDSKNKSCLTLPELAKWVVLNIIEYNHTANRPNDESPLQRWDEAWAKLGGQKANHKVLDEQTFKISFLDLVTGRINKDGIHWATKRYSAPYLSSYRVGVKYEARVDPMDTRIIFLKTPDGYVPIQRQTPAEYDDRALEDLHRKGKRMRSRNPLALSIIESSRTQAAELVEAAEKRKRAMRSDPLSSPLVQVVSEAVEKADNELQKQQVSFSLKPGKYIAPGRALTVNRY